MEILSFENVDQLQSVLDIYNIDTTTWFKTPEQMLKDIWGREIDLGVEKDTLYILCKSVRVRIYSPCRSQVLEEDYQIRRSDGKRTSKKVLRQSVNEKMKLDGSESVLETAYRAIKEELCGHTLEYKQEDFELEFDEKYLVEAEAFDYRGINFRTEDYCYTTVLKPEYYIPEGYVESQPHKDVYFVWKKLDKMFI